MNIKDLGAEAWRTLGQLFRYGIAGLATNLLLYLGYLIATGQGLTPRMAATLCFVCGVSLSFTANRRIAFRAGEVPLRRKAVFAGAYVCGYLAHLLGLYLLVDLWRLPHQAVQLFLILAIAAGLFLVQKFLVFGTAGDRAQRIP